MRINFALALTSAVFMMTWVMSFVSVIFHSMPIVAPELITFNLLYIAIIELLIAVSLIGSILFLFEGRKVLALWYLAIPLCISLFVFIFTNFFVYSSEKQFLCAPINTVEMLWIIILAFLSPCSTLFFLASNGCEGSKHVYVAISLATSIFSMFFLFLALCEIPKLWSIEEVILPLIFYCDVCMPTLGVCFLSNATMYRANNSENEA